MRWAEASVRYVQAMLQRGLSVRTVEGRRFWLGHWEAFCLQAGVGEVAAVTAGLVARYREAVGQEVTRTGKPWAQASQDSALLAMRGFLRWAVAQGFLLVDPTDGLVVRRRPLPLHAVLRADQVDAMRDAADPGTLLGLRDRALLELLYGAGLRRRECFDLDTDDVDLAGRAVRVRCGKGGRERYVPLGDWLCEALSVYVTDSRAVLSTLNPAERAFFLDMHGQRLSYASVGKRVNRLARRGLGQVRGPHALRHAVATHLLEGGADVREVQEFLGHEHVDSTQVYTHLHAPEQRQMYRQTHPRARWSPPNP